jgi:hypothetical protein
MEFPKSVLLARDILSFHFPVVTYNCHIACDCDVHGRRVWRGIWRRSFLISVISTLQIVSSLQTYNCHIACDCDIHGRWIR